MIDKIFLDTNILVYLFDKSEKQKHTFIIHFISNRLLDSKIFVSIQVINEFINVTSKKISSPVSIMKQKEILELLNELFLIAPLNLSTSRKALEINETHKFSFWDSLIVASALENNCNIIYTEDLQHGYIIENKLSINNPFNKK